MGWFTRSKARKGSVKNAMNKSRRNTNASISNAANSILRNMEKNANNNTKKRVVELRSDFEAASKAAAEDVVDELKDIDTTESEMNDLIDDLKESRVRPGSKGILAWSIGLYLLVQSAASKFKSILPDEYMPGEQSHLSKLEKLQHKLNGTKQSGGGDIEIDDDIRPLVKKALGLGTFILYGAGVTVKAAFWGTIGIVMTMVFIFLAQGGGTALTAVGALTASRQISNISRTMSDKYDTLQRTRFMAMDYMFPPEWRFGVVKSIRGNSSGIIKRIINGHHIIYKRKNGRIIVDGIEYILVRDGLYIDETGKAAESGPIKNSMIRHFIEELDPRINVKNPISIYNRRQGLGPGPRNN